VDETFLPMKLFEYVPDPGAGANGEMVPW